MRISILRFCITISKYIIFILIMLIFFTFNHDLYSFTYNHRNVPIGERAALMGGAYTALSEDISGAYYNPAGLAFLSFPSLSMTVSAFNFSSIKRKTYLARTGAFSTETSTITKTNEFTAIPSAFGFSFNFENRYTLSFSIFQIDKITVSSLSADDTATSQTSVKLEMLREVYYMGPSFAAKLSDDIAIGLSLFLQYTQIDFKFFHHLIDPPINVTTDVSNNSESWGLRPILGFKWNVVKSLKFGISYAVETIPLYGKNNYSWTQSGFSNEEESDIAHWSLLMPHQISVGIAFDLPEVITLSFDFVYYFPLNYRAPREYFRPDKEDVKHQEGSHIDLSLGCELYLSRNFAMRMGLFTNTSGATNQDGSENIDYYGGSLGIGFRSGGLSTGLGIIVSYGESNKQELTQFAADAWSMHAEQKILNVTFIFGGTFLFGS